MKFIIGFFMAWGNFLTLPCPYKRWDNELKNMMLAFLPAVGAVIGVLFMALSWLLGFFTIAPTMAAFIMTFYIYAICGFMHLDGFMDCNDAIMSRRPLEERQRILKDSHTGAFAVITIVFLFMAFYISALTAYDYINENRVILFIIPVFSRGMAALFVLTYKPIGHSQYVKDYGVDGRGWYRVAVVVQLLVAGAIALILSDKMIYIAMTMAIMAVTAFLGCMYARKQLGGMSGDIAGYTISITEAAGIIALAMIS